MNVSKSGIQLQCFSWGRSEKLYKVVNRNTSRRGTTPSIRHRRLCSRAARDLLQAIQALPSELREKILKIFLATRIEERKKVGWGEVHEALRWTLFWAPRCEEKGWCITRLIKCTKCNWCGRDGLCNMCLKEGYTHHIRNKLHIPYIYRNIFVEYWWFFFPVCNIGGKMIAVCETFLSLVIERLNPSREIIQEVRRVMEELNEGCLDRVSVWSWWRSAPQCGPIAFSSKESR